MAKDAKSAIFELLYLVAFRDQDISDSKKNQVLFWLTLFNDIFTILEPIENKSPIKSH